MRRLLKDQSLRKFLEMKGNIYPYLVRVFYTNLKFEGNNLVFLKQVVFNVLKNPNPFKDVEASALLDVAVLV